ncbi:unnamed protein product [Chondrus crispus]|uniref:Uncharacterized protein n=1 Tax=Chondrus crispus TaxID=2769 RepID=R7Q2P1_CHOCR|nr:unnamed protein product [Chondrus crispus]CDF32309.1 unnamed protein product [Chondrus crispus]|eukprot:XP_005711974.1 unnamed protein product [Chondrus crispus]
MVWVRSPLPTILATTLLACQCFVEVEKRRPGQLCACVSRKPCQE